MNASTTATTTTFCLAVIGAFLLGMASGSLCGKITDKGNKKGRVWNGDASNLEEEQPAPRRFGSAIKMKPEMYTRYRELHDHVWDEVLDRMHRSNIRNFVIYYHEETSTLFQHFEWVGHWKGSLDRQSSLSATEEKELFQADMKAIKEDEVTRKWWLECEPCQEPFSQWKKGAVPLSKGGRGDWWAPMQCLTHCGHWPIAFSSQRRDPDFSK